MCREVLSRLVYGRSWVTMKTMNKHTKYILSLVLAACIALSAFAPALAERSLSNFSVIRTYRGEFSDISPDAWYFDGVVGAFERGLMSGKGDGLFDPAGRMTIAETITIAAMLHRGYHTGSMDFESGSPWYAPYRDYAILNGIPVGAYRNMSAVATRADFAVIIAGALPDEALTPINRIADGALPDVYESYSYGAAVYKLCRAGVITGSGREGHFFPGRTISRAEAATLILRAASADERVSFSPARMLSAEQIYRLASPAVFFIEVFDDEGSLLRTGSGFFISESGLAVTNYHVVIGADTARVTMDGGEVCNIAGVYDYFRAQDLALIQIEGGGFPYLEIADSSRILTGATVYALGSPLGLQASFSRGIVSQSQREVEGVQYIQIDAPISSGSSGGALLDASGRVVGVTSATMIGGQIVQNLNLAVPINFLDEMSRDEYRALDAMIVEAVSYAGYHPAPDFGAFFEVRRFNTGSVRGGTAFSYRLSDLPKDVDEIIDEYTHLIEQRLFVHFGYITSGGVEFKTYSNARHGILLSIGIEEIRGVRCITIAVS